MGNFLQMLGLQEAAAQSGLRVHEGTVDTLTYRLEESLAQLELAREDNGWQRLIDMASQDFTREGLRTAAPQGRVFGIANPLIMPCGAS